jgi:zinc protease
MRYPPIVRFFTPAAIGLMLLAVYFYHAQNPSRPRDLRAAIPVTQFTLKNGLQVVVMENHNIPIVTHLMLVKAGGADDPRGKTGMAHYLEHLMFTGSKNYPEGTYDRAIARIGGEHNAFTTKDYTLYYATIAREHLPQVMAMEADRFASPTFDAAKAARELKVITEERNMRVENNPAAQMAEQLDAITFLNHPYQRPNIGWAEDMATFTLADAQAFFAAHYTARNMLLLVAGDVTAADVKRDAEKYYAALPSGIATPRIWPEEPPLRLERHATMHDAKVREPRLVRQYIAPSVVNGARDQALPLSVFAQYLGGGAGSVLYEQLVEKEKLASSVSASYDPFSIGPALFTIHATPAARVTPQQLEHALDRALDGVNTGAPDAAAVMRAKTRLKAEVIFAQDGLSSFATTIADLYALGLDEQYFYAWPHLVEAVTPAQMQEAARIVLAPSRRVTGYLLPAETQAAPTPAMEVTHAP